MNQRRRNQKKTTKTPIGLNLTPIHPSIMMEHRLTQGLSVFPMNYCGQQQDIKNYRQRDYVNCSLLVDSRTTRTMA